MANRSDVLAKINEWLAPENFQDYAPNGLQVEGREHVDVIVSGVTASQALIDEAVKQNADMILVHHGYFWKGEDQTIRGMKKNRIKQLLDNDINLVAYHLPLDDHPEYGNNRQLADILGIQNPRPMGGLVWQGELPGTHVIRKVRPAPRKSPAPAAASRRQWPGNDQDCRLVHRGSSGVHQRSFGCGCRRLHQRRDLRADDSHGQRVRDSLLRGRPPCDRTVWCSGSGRSISKGIRSNAPVHRLR